MKKRSPLQQIRSAWKKASPAERAEFLREIGATTSSSSWSGACVDADRYLLPHAENRIKLIMSKVPLAMGDVMVEMGYGPLRPPAMSRARRTRIPAHMIVSLEKWLDDKSQL